MTVQGNLIRLLGCIAAFLTVIVFCGLTPASGLAAEPELTVQATTPDTLQAGQSTQIDIGIVNEGTATSHGPIVITDTPGAQMGTPAGSFLWGSTFTTSVRFPEGSEEEQQETPCETVGESYVCTVPMALPPGATLSGHLEVEVKPSATGVVTNTLTVSGGEAPSVSTQQHIAVGPPGEFALTSLGATLQAGSGPLSAPVTQAAATPADFTTSLRWATAQHNWSGLYPLITAVEHFKNVTVHLPVGFTGNPTSTASFCTSAELVEKYEENGPYLLTPRCPPDSQVGVANISLTGIASTRIVGLYNMTPPPGAATELGFNLVGTIVLIDGYVRPGDSGIDFISRNTSTTMPIRNVSITAWGDPESPSHDRLRGTCLASSEGADGQVCPTSAPEKAFLRMPTSCSGVGLPFGADSNSYEHPNVSVSATFTGPVVTGCERVPFSPSIDVVPTATAANSPTGVAVKLSLPQNDNPKGLWEADLKKAVVTLPEGMVLNPSSADGLQACSDAQLRIGLAGPSECPDGSKIGTVELHTPLLANPIEGFIWLRPQNSSDSASGEMFRIAIELRDDRHGIDIKVPGKVAADPATGRLTSTFDDNPQLPFEDITLHFKSGARAPLTTPPSCRAQTTEANLYPWSEPDRPVHSDMTFQLTSGPEGTPCVATQQFAPAFNAGVSSVQAGGFTPFLTTFSRKDADQSMQRVSVTMPKGLLGSLVGLPLCAEAQANAGTCDQASEIGTVTAGAGDGPTPFYVTGGHVYMTGPYEGAPFGLSVVVPAKAGPFDLGTVVVRAKVEVDVHTAQLTVTTDPLPQIVGGVPVNLRLVNVTINRPNFTYNPTDCEPMEVAGRLVGGQGGTAALSNHFQVTNCGALRFQPKFSVSTSSKTSRRIGASLDAKLSYPHGAPGTQANIAKVKVSLPRQLPSRLATLQKACPAETFEANPAACPSASRIGAATASTPVLPVPLNGPVYFVSHGGQAFPDLVVVLQGYGVTIDLVGNTFINKDITSTTFKQVPDVPVGSFELKLPQGPNSALAANGNLCASKLKMPTTFIGQDGAQIHANTPIAVSGCARHRSHKRRAKHKKHNRRK